MKTRRRPRHHVRRTASGVVDVNTGVEYDKNTTSPVDTGGVRLSVGGLVDVHPVFPDPKFKQEAKLSFGQRLKRRFVADHRIRDARDIVSSTLISWQKVSINPKTGKGVLLCKIRRRDLWLRQPLGPGVVLGSRHLRCGGDFPLVDLSGATFRCYDLTSLNLQGAKLDDAKFVVNSIWDVNMDGASIRNVKFPHCELIGKLSMVGTDVTGTDFSGIVTYSNYQAFSDRFAVNHGAGDSGIKKVIDLTDSNVTREQIVQLEQGSSTTTELPVIYREYSINDVAAATGISEEELSVLIWAGDVEVRGNSSRRPVETFDARTWHVPQWELQRLLASS